MGAGGAGGTDPGTTAPRVAECRAEAIAEAESAKLRLPAVLAAKAAESAAESPASPAGGAIGGTRTIGAVTHIVVARPACATQKAETPAAILAAPAPLADIPTRAAAIALRPGLIVAPTRLAPETVAPRK